MSNKDLAIQLINQIPDYKLGYAIAYLQGLYADEMSDDIFCQKLLEDYENSTDKGEFVSFEEAMKMCEVDINAIQDWVW